MVLEDVRKVCRVANNAVSPLSKEEQKTFFDYVAIDSKYSYLIPLFTVMIGTGMRVSEAIGLRWEDVDLENRIIDVNHGLRYESHDGNKAFFITNTKTAAGIRKIPMIDSVYNAFKSVYEQQCVTGFCDITVDGMTNFVFLSDQDRLHTQQRLNQNLKSIVKIHNEMETLRSRRDGDKPVFLPRITCYTFRHTFATRLCASETNLKVIQGLMGHADIKTTMNVYAGFDIDKEKEAMDKLELEKHIFE